MPGTCLEISGDQKKGLGMKLKGIQWWLLVPPQAGLDTHSRPSSAHLSKGHSSQKGTKSPIIISLPSRTAQKQSREWGGTQTPQPTQTIQKSLARICIDEQHNQALSLGLLWVQIHTGFFSNPSSPSPSVCLGYFINKNEISR